MRFGVSEFLYSKHVNLNRNVFLLETSLVKKVYEVLDCQSRNLAEAVSAHPIALAINELS